MPNDVPSHPTFPAYLLPTLPFPRRDSGTAKRRTSSAASISSSLMSAFSSSPTTTPLSSANTTPSSSPPRVQSFSRRFSSFSSALQQGLREDEREYCEDAAEDEGDKGLSRTEPDTLKCSTCATDIAFAEQIVSKGFTGRHGRAYLVSAPAEEGVKDLVNTKVGKAVNRQLVTGAHVVADISCKICSTVVGWKYVDAKEVAQRYKIGKFILETKKVVKGWSWEDGPREEECERAEEKRKEVVEFDSEDEDECEEIFTGTWDRDVVAKRRAKRVGNRRRDG